MSNISARRTHPYTADMLRVAASKLERTAGRMRAIASMMDEDSSLETLYVFNHPSMDQAEKAAVRFAAEVEGAMDAFNAGNPYGPDTLKTRSAASPRRAAASNGEKKPRKKRAPKKSAGTGGAGEKGEG